MSYYAIENPSEITQLMFHSGWYSDEAKICVKSTHLALANQFVHEMYQNKHYNVLGANKTIIVERCHYSVKGKKYCYTLKLR